MDQALPGRGNRGSGEPNLAGWSATDSGSNTRADSCPDQSHPTQRVRDIPLDDAGDVQVREEDRERVRVAGLGGEALAGSRPEAMAARHLQDLQGSGLRGEGSRHRQLIPEPTRG